ncbi:expressed unknown protein [Seminavis robusta]|uniref:CRAL-TRIO domain-containing protein n=1 Tax=Seminavis robusta TaxID=568900 RepID=A0A9N8F452_9STRA|nr:expressed unknown protein [Seminavis robusta]|eukprot:Sro2868_g339050.1 n/a (325) ;mRNA; f:6744-7718
MNDNPEELAAVAGDDVPAEAVEQADHHHDNEHHHAVDLEEEDDEDEEGEFVNQGVLNTRILGPTDPRRMQLSREERDWALDIKDVIEGTPEINNISDFMCAQLAIIHQDDIATAVESASKLQISREEYDIRDTLEDGIVKLQILLDLNPGNNLSFSFSHQEGCYVLVCDLGKMDMNLMKDNQNVYKSLGGAFYQNHALTPDLESIRRGVIFILECDGCTWIPRLCEMKYHEKYWAEIGGIYPFCIRQYKFFHTPMFFNMIKSLGRPFIPKDIYSKMQIGCQFPHGRLDTVYLVPSWEATKQRFLGRMAETLKLRYENERNFSLS